MGVGNYLWFIPLYFKYYKSNYNCKTNDKQPFFFPWYPRKQNCRVFLKMEHKPQQIFYFLKCLADGIKENTHTKVLSNYTKNNGKYFLHAL